MIYNSLSNASFDHNHAPLAQHTGSTNRSNIISNMVTTEANFSEIKKSALMDENATCFLRSPQHRVTSNFEQTSLVKSNKIKQEMINDECQQPKSCKKCHLPIDDRYIYNVKDSYWHDKCLTCFHCGDALKEKCYETETGALYCWKDFKKFVCFLLIIVFN